MVVGFLNQLVHVGRLCSSHCGHNWLTKSGISKKKFALFRFSFTIKPESCSLPFPPNSLCVLPALPACPFPCIPEPIGVRKKQLSEQIHGGRHEEDDEQW